ELAQSRRPRDQSGDGPRGCDPAQGRIEAFVRPPCQAGGAMTDARLLIACVGNIFLGDDAFGVEVARRLAAMALPDGVRVVDFGIRGIDLTYALLDGYDSVTLVDAAPRGGTPGTLYMIEPDASGSHAPEAAGSLLDAHSMDPAKVLRLASTMGGR